MNMKKYLSLVLALVMILVMAPCALADAEEEHLDSCSSKIKVDT